MEFFSSPIIIILFQITFLLVIIVFVMNVFLQTMVFADNNRLVNYRDLVGNERSIDNPCAAENYRCVDNDREQKILLKIEKRQKDMNEHLIDLKGNQKI